MGLCQNKLRTKNENKLPIIDAVPITITTIPTLENDNFLAKPEDHLTE